jgi:hypothetical protein
LLFCSHLMTFACPQIPTSLVIFPTSLLWNSLTIPHWNSVIRDHCISSFWSWWHEKQPTRLLRHKMKPRCELTKSCESEQLQTECLSLLNKIEGLHN